MLKFGLEVEAFIFSTEGKELQIPPINFPVDGFPLLVEFRSKVHDDIYAAFGDIMGQFLLYDDKLDEDKLISTSDSRVRVPPALSREIRRTRAVQKRVVDVRNLYGKAPKSLDNYATASCQINISNQITPGYYGKDGSFINARYGLVDIPQIVKALDDEFKDHISASKRQPGEYAIKDFVRLEYRSLPNSVAFEDDFCLRVNKAIYNYKGS